MATISSNASWSSSSASISGTTAVLSTISWTVPTIPNGAVIESCVLTGTPTITMNKGTGNVTVNGTSVTSGSQFSINLGTGNTTNSVQVSCKGNNKNASGTVTFSDLVYTVTYVLEYTVTFKDWDGTVLETQTVEEGSSATAPSNPTRDGYNFTGWDVDFSNVTSNLTVTAQYSIQSYTVIFKDWNGTILKTQTVNYGSAVIAPSDPTREGYKFTGWDNDFNNVISDLIVTAQYEKEVAMIEWTGIGTVATDLKAHAGDDSYSHDNYKINLDWENESFDIIITGELNRSSNYFFNIGTIGDIKIGDIEFNILFSDGGISIYCDDTDSVLDYYNTDYGNFPFIISFTKKGIYVKSSANTGEYSTPELLSGSENIYEINQPIYFIDDGLIHSSVSNQENPEYNVIFDLAVSEFIVEEPEDPDLIEPVDGYIAKNLVSYGDWSYTFNVDWDTKYLDIEVLNYEYGLFGTSYYYNINNNSYNGEYSHESADNFTIHGVEVESDRNDIDIIRYSKVDGVCIITSNGTQIIPGNSFTNDNKMTVKADIITEWFKEEDGFMTFNIKITDITPSEEPSEPISENLFPKFNSGSWTYEEEHEAYLENMEEYDTDVSFETNYYSIYATYGQLDMIKGKTVKLGVSSIDPNIYIEMGEYRIDNSTLEVIISVGDNESCTLYIRSTTSGYISGSIKGAYLYIIDDLPEITTYTVTFKDWDGTTLKTQNVEDGASATAPDDPTRDGHVFTGWDVDFSNVTSDLIVTAQYEKIEEPDNNELVQGDINDETGVYEDEVPNVVKTKYIDISDKKQILVNVLTEDVYILKCYLYNANKELVKIIDISADKKRMFGLDLQKLIEEVMNDGNE